MKRYLISIMMMGLLGSLAASAMDVAAPDAIKQVGLCAKEKTHYLQKHNVKIVLGSILVGSFFLVQWVWQLKPYALAYDQVCVAHAACSSGVRAADAFSLLAQVMGHYLFGCLKFASVSMGMLTACSAINKWYVNRRFAAREKQAVDTIKGDAGALRYAENTIVPSLERIRDFHKKVSAFYLGDADDIAMRKSIGLSGKFNKQQHFLFCDYIRRAQNIPENIGIFHRIARALDWCY